MRYHPDNEIWRFDTERFVVTCEAWEELDSPDDHFCFEDDVAFATSGDPAAWFCAAVRVWLKWPSGTPLHAVADPGEELGTAVLGGCSYRSFHDFVGWRMSRRGTKLLAADYFNDMVRESLGYARRELNARKARLEKIELRAIAA